jgi:hypothetical protein
LELRLPEIDTKFALLLDSIDGIGPIKYQKIIERFYDLNSFVSGVNTAILEECGVSDKQASAIANSNHSDKFNEIIEKANGLNVFAADNVIL